jgi:tetratricopeptide (TPR) repeat protein
LGALTLILIFLQTGTSRAAEPCEPAVGRLVTVEGQVDVQRTGTTPWIPAKLQDSLCQGDSVRAGERSRAAITLANQAVLRVDQSTTIRLVNIAPQEEESSILDLFRGALQSFSRKPRLLQVNTPYVNGVVEGTEFVFRVEANQSILTVFEGTVQASNPQGSVSVGAGQSVAAEAGKAPQPRTVVRPRDAAQWALYYPPVLAALGGGAPDVTGMSPSLRQAIESAGRGDSAAAFNALDRVSTADRDARFHLYKAALLLAVGQVDEARTNIDGALKLDANAGLAYALRAVINVVQNDNAQALADANQAVTLSPDAAAPKVALSYAQQAGAQIAQARGTMLQAVEQQPEDPLAWARLAELQLMLGFRERAIEAAEKAASLAPDLARTQIAQGFTYLTEFRTAEAKAAFERAIALNSADPLPRLGLGLAKISAGDLEAGRSDLEVAVGLDSNNALLRAYLGKAYFEEKRAPLDGEQFGIAKQLDPFDPTAFLYDGIRKQTENQPVAALRDLEKSIELNDNRAAYRGRLLLDQDRAARGTSVARVYKDLGFNQLGITESAKSLALDPSNASAHRFLSDTYRGVRRLEIARVSELLQAQLMQDINISPVQPSLSATNLNIVTLGGPASAGFNEFTPLFARNKAQFDAAAVGGNKDTYGGEAVVSGLYDRYSFSVGAFTYNTDGWRPNNALDRDIYNVFGQAAITPKLNVQAELRHQESEAGDLAFNFDPTNFLLDKTDTRDQDTFRLGLRYTPTPRSKQNILLSWIHNDRDETLSQSESLDPFTTLSIDSDVRDKGDQFEGQYIYQQDRWNVVAGAAYSDSNRDITDTITISDVVFGPLDTFGGTLDQTVEHSRGYVIGGAHLGENSVDLTVGASYDDYQEGILEETSFNPKFGAQWHVNDDVRVRAAAFKVMKPLVVNNRTIEPTQIAGFNQFFDDINGTKSWRYGIGFDWQPMPGLNVGGEATQRDLDEPIFILFEDPPRTDFEDREEQLHRLYLYWTPSEQIGVTAELVYDRYESEMGIATEFDNLPEKVRTVSLPVGVSYFHPSGFFAGVVGTYVDQEVTRSASSTRGQGEDSFFVVDAALGYRFPKRRGIASIGVKNLFDEEFNYQDDSYREFRGESSTGPYFPELMVRASVTLNF